MATAHSAWSNEAVIWILVSDLSRPVCGSNSVTRRSARRTTFFVLRFGLGRLAMSTIYSTIARGKKAPQPGSDSSATVPRRGGPPYAKLPRRAIPAPDAARQDSRALRPSRMAIRNQTRRLPRPRDRRGPPVPPRLQPRLRLRDVGSALCGDRPQRPLP